MKAADISDRTIYECVADEKDRRESSWATTQILDDPRLSMFPHKVVMAKLRQMIAKGRLNGCACGCRGEFHLSDLSNGSVERERASAA